MFKWWTYFADKFLDGTSWKKIIIKWGYMLLQNEVYSLNQQPVYMGDRFLTDEMHQFGNQGVQNGFGISKDYV